MEELGGVKKWNIKKRDVFITPQQAHDDATEWCGFDTRTAFDPCPYPAAADDGLTIAWQSPAYCNPPFSKAYNWVSKAIAEADNNGVTTCMLLPWYCWYGPPRKTTGRSRVYKLVMDRKSSKQRDYTFQHPTPTEPSANIGVKFVLISPSLPERSCPQNQRKP